jgi:hypothetical protein
MCHSVTAAAGYCGQMSNVIKIVKILSLIFSLSKNHRTSLSKFLRFSTTFIRSFIFDKQLLCQVKQMGYTPDIGTASVFSTLSLNSIIGCVCFILFECFRGQTEIYAPRSRTKADRCPPIVPSAPGKCSICYI